LIGVQNIKIALQFFIIGDGYPEQGRGFVYQFGH
jgi:hypothetical protein